MITLERTRFLVAPLMAALVALHSGCQTRQSVARPAAGSTFSTPQSARAETDARVREQCGPLGQPVPRRGEAARLGPTRLIARFRQSFQAYDFGRR